jgi:hypothetical protein
MIRRAVVVMVFVACALPAQARTFCWAKVHGKGLANLSDPVWAEDYWFNGQFASIAQPCAGMPAATTHADGTYGMDVAFDRAYCGCGIERWYGCDYLWRPQNGLADPGVNRPRDWPNGWNGANTDDPINQCVKSGPYSPRQWSTPNGYKGVMEQLYEFIVANGCTDLAIVTHSNGGNIVREGFSLANLYLGSKCKLSNGSYDPGCLSRKDHQLTVINTTSTVLQLHAPSTGSEAANVVKTLAGSWYTGWVADILNPYDRATQELTTASMAMANSRMLFGTAGRTWPTYDNLGNALPVPKWISFVSPLTGTQIIEDGGHTEDYELYGLATFVAFPNAYSDGLVSWPSQAAVGTVWYFQGQHDIAANAYPTQSSWRGNNHSDDRLGAAGGGRWTPLYYRAEPTYLAPGVVPPFQGPGGSDCWGSLADFYCIGWPWPSTSHGNAVPACPDLICKANFTRGNPDGADEAFAVSAYLGARVAVACGPTITQQSVWNGQYRTLYHRQGMNGLDSSHAYWQPLYNYPLYDYYYPTAGSTADHNGPPICNWQC